MLNVGLYAFPCCRAWRDDFQMLDPKAEDRIFEAFIGLFFDPEWLTSDDWLWEMPTAGENHPYTDSVLNHEARDRELQFRQQAPSESRSGKGR
jgi:hypothetical protein